MYSLQVYIIMIIRFKKNLQGWTSSKFQDDHNDGSLTFIILDHFTRIVTEMLCTQCALNPETVIINK